MLSTVARAARMVLVVAAGTCLTGCFTPSWPAIYRASDNSNFRNGGLLGKEYVLTQDVAMVREGWKRPVLAPLPQPPRYGAGRTAGPSRALGGAWGLWGKQRLAHYRPHCDTPCQVPAQHEVAPKGVQLKIEYIVVEDLRYPPPVFYVQARLQSGRYRGTLVDVSELIEDCVPPDSIWRDRPIVANDEYLEPLVRNEPVSDAAELVKSLDDTYWEARYRAVQQLGSVDADPAIAVPAILYAREDLDPEVSCEAIESLGRIGPRAEKAIPMLVATMKRNDRPEGYCRRAAVALAQIGRPVSTVLLDALSDKTWKFRYRAADGLASLGSEAAPALPALLAVLQSPGKRDDYDTPEYIGAAIYRIAREEGASAVLQLLRTGGEEQRQQAARALGAMGPCSEEVLSALVEMASEERFMTRVYAICALGKFGDKATPAVSIITRALEDESEPGIVALTAVEALGQIGPTARAAIPAIERYARRCGIWDRQTVLEALQAIRGR